MTRNGSTRSPGIGVTDRRTGDTLPPPDVDPR